MTTADLLPYIKPEGTPSPPPMISIPLGGQPYLASSSLPIDSKDPENFLRRCCGTKHRTKLRCTALISQRVQHEFRPVYLPTCGHHAHQKLYAGRCRSKLPTGERCNILFRWTPLQLELCPKHYGQPSDLPCYLLKLPTELRYEIFRYLLPTEPIGSSTASLHWDAPIPSNNPYGVQSGSLNFRAHKMPLGQRRSPMPLISLLLINQQINLEVLDLFYSITTFNIDIRKDGTFMCGRRLLEPCRADGTAHSAQDSQTDESKERFLKTFRPMNLKLVTINILLEDWSSAQIPPYTRWDEEVEIYDLRDYVNVVVSGILSKAQSLNKLTFNLCLADFDWTEEQILVNTKTLIEPLQRLNNVRRARIDGIYSGRPYHNAMIVVYPQCIAPGQTGAPPFCSIPSMPRHTPVLLPGMPVFDAFVREWSAATAVSFSRPVPPPPPIRTMFIKFKNFYTRLSQLMPELADQHLRCGRSAFMHRARVAREQEDVETIRTLSSVLTQYWGMYLEREDRKKADMQKCLDELDESDTYPHNEWVPFSDRLQETTAAQAPDQQGLVQLNADNMTEDDILVMGSSSLMPISIDSQGDETPDYESAHTPAAEDFDSFMTNINVAPSSTTNTLTYQPAQSQDLAQQAAIVQMQRQMAATQVDIPASSSLARSQSMSIMQQQAQRVQQAQMVSIRLEAPAPHVGVMYQQGLQQVQCAAPVPPSMEANAEVIDLTAPTLSPPSCFMSGLVDEEDSISGPSVERHRVTIHGREPSQADEIVILDEESEEAPGWTRCVLQDEDVPEATYSGKGKGVQRDT